MDNKMAEDAIKDAIANRRLAKQPYDAGLEEALEIILTPITEYPDVQRIIVQVGLLQIENKRLKEVLKPAEKAIISLHCNYEGTRAPHDGRVPGCKLCADLEIIQQALKV